MVFSTTAAPVPSQVWQPSVPAAPGFGKARTAARIGANVRVSRTFPGCRYETASFFRIFSSHARGDFL
jgi:hypothetical protein